METNFGGPEDAPESPLLNVKPAVINKNLSNFDFCLYFSFITLRFHDKKCLNRQSLQLFHILDDVSKDLFTF